MKTIATIRKKLKKVKDKEHKIVIASSALDVIKTECGKWKSLEKECGGSLIGRYVRNICFILYAIRTGYFAHQSFGGVTTDSDYQNKVFDVLSAKYPEANLIYLGDYHLHPMYLPTLSGTDERTCCEILSEPRHQNIPKLAVILTTYSDGRQVIYPYLASRNKAGNEHRQIPIAKTTLDVVESNDLSVTKLLKREYVDVDSITNELSKEIQISDAKAEEVTFLNTFHETPFYQIPVVKERFMEEIDKLKNQFRIGITPTYADDGIINLEFRVRGTNVHIFFPREYPLNPPTILFGSDESELSEFSSTKNWNSMSSCVDLLEELFERRELSWKTVL